MTFTAEQVKKMAAAKGLPCTISQRKGMKLISPVSTLESLGMYREWSKYYSRELNGLIVAFRQRQQRDPNAQELQQLQEAANDSL